jgi:hypothetical protein
MIKKPCCPPNIGNIVSLMSSSNPFNDDKSNSACCDNSLQPINNIKGHGKPLDATFVDDLNLQDEDVVFYGDTFSKTWVVKNSGTKKWRNVKLVHQEGFAPLQSELPVPDIFPGESVELTVNYPAISDNDGSSIASSWRLIHNKTTPFGCALWLCVQAIPRPERECDIIVDGANKEGSNNK